MACCRPLMYSVTLVTVLVSLTLTQVIADEQDAARLIKFKSSLSNTRELSNWNDSVPVCNYIGVLCSQDGTVLNLELESMGLGGTLDMDTLAEITSIRILSFSNNSFEGWMPNLKKMIQLRLVSLSYNKFSGEIRGDAFSGMTSLMRVDLENNGFTGKIPVSLTQLPILVLLQLQNNEFDGEIPEFEQQNDLTVNFSNNRLDGSIPNKLSNQDPNSFAGNNLCGKPLSPCAVSSPNGTSGSSRRSSSKIISICSCFIMIMKFRYM